MPGHAGKVDDDPSFLVGREKSSFGFGVLRIDRIGDVGVDHKGPHGLLCSESEHSFSAQRRDRERVRWVLLTLTFNIFSKLGIESTMLLVHSCLMAIPAQWTHPDSLPEPDSSWDLKWFCAVSIPCREEDGSGKQMSL